MKCIKEEVELKYDDLFHIDLMYDDKDSMIGLLEDQQEPLELDELGLPLQPATLIARKARVDVEQWVE